MKFENAALASALAGSAAAVGALSPSALTGLTAIMPSSMLASGIATSFTRNQVNSGYGKTGGIFSSLSSVGSRVDMTPRYSKQVPGSKTVKMRYGPYSVPSMMKKNGLGEGGSLWNYPDTSVPKPCEKCVIVGMQAGLEYTDGRSANVDSQAWLHHMVMFNIGPGRVDQTCSTAYSSLPHANVGCTPSNCERMFASGNERTPVTIVDWATMSDGKKLAGYHVKPSDKFAFIIDLMNDSGSDKNVYVTMTYDYVDGWPANIDDMRPVWFDADQCGLSEVQPKSQSGPFTISAWSWSATMDGEVLGYAGHLHDGGLRMNMDVDGSLDCSSTATYGGDSAYIATAGSMMPAGSATTHISKMSICGPGTAKNRMMKKGQRWTLSADYDYTKHKGVLDEDGTQDSVMGIAIMYVRQPQSALDSSSSSSWWKRLLSSE